MRISILFLLLAMLCGCDGAGGSDYTVYVTKSGGSYHRSTCYTIKGSSVFTMTHNQAVNAGYGQCQVCKP